MLTFKKAKKDSLIKWDYARKTGCNRDALDTWLLNNYVKIFNYKSSCGLCEKHYPNCCNCKLQKYWKIDCEDKNSLFFKWLFAKTTKKRKKYAEKIYQDILSLEEIK